MGLWGLVGIAVAVYAALELKTSRPDGKLVTPHPDRRMLPYINPSQSSAHVYFDDYVRAENLVTYIQESGKLGKKTDVTACVVAAVAIGLDTAPDLNRFLAGRRMYQRNVRKISFTALRAKKDRNAATGTVHITVVDDWTFDDLLKVFNDKIAIERSGAVTYTDKELNLFLSMPRAVIAVAVAALKWLDRRNLLPASFIDNDPLYCSLFLANLGSLGMRAGYHHLFEWGNCPLFLTIGEIEKMPVVENGDLVMRDMLHLRYSFDERIDDGINANGGIVAVRDVLEDPFEMLGCIKNDGSDRRPLKGIANAR